MLILKSFLEIISRLSRKQDGQILILGAGLFILALVALMIAVDVGYWASDKRDAQNDADSIALAAAQELPDTTAAELRGEDWAVLNNIDPSTQMVPPPCSGIVQGNFCFEDLNGDGNADLVRVQVSRPSESFIANALGVATPTLNPRAAAAKIRAYGACVLPWAIDAVEPYEDPYAYAAYWGIIGNDPNPETLFIFQLSPGGGFAGEQEGGSPGSFGALGVYGKNDRDYRDSIINECGSQGQDACDSGSQIVTEGSTMDCDIQTGNLGATTDKALSERADRYLEAAPYTDCDADSYGMAVDKAASCLGRQVVLAIIEDFPGSGFESIDVYGIANFYIAGWDRCPPYNDGDCDGSPDTGLVWGYVLLEEVGATAAWQFDFTKPSNNPVAPVAVFLVE